jgi:hypothetical protein
VRRQSLGKLRHRQSLPLNEDAIQIVFHRVGDQRAAKHESQLRGSELDILDIKLTFKTIWESLMTPGPTIRGPFGCACAGSSSFSPVYFGLGSDANRPAATEAMFDFVQLVSRLALRTREIFYRDRGGRPETMLLVDRSVVVCDKTYVVDAAGWPWRSSKSYLEVERGGPSSALKSSLTGLKSELAAKKRKPLLSRHVAVAQAFPARTYEPLPRVCLSEVKRSSPQHSRRQ